MRFSCTVFILFVLLLVSCKSKDKKSIELPFPEEKVIDILVDMHFAGEASRVTKGLNHDSLLNVYTNQVLEIQKIDSTDLETLMKLLHSDLTTYYDIEKKVHSKIKDLKGS